MWGVARVGLCRGARLKVGGSLLLRPIRHPLEVNRDVVGHRILPDLIQLRLGERHVAHPRHRLAAAREEQEFRTAVQGGYSCTYALVQGAGDFFAPDRPHNLDLGGAPNFSCKICQCNRRVTVV